MNSVQIVLVIDFKVYHDIYMAIVREVLYCVVKTLFLLSCPISLQQKPNKKLVSEKY